MAFLVTCPCGAEYELLEPSLSACFNCTVCGVVYAVVETEGVPVPGALPAGQCRCGAPVELNGVAVGARVQCACSRGIWAVRAGDPRAPRTAPRAPRTDPWNDVLSACSSSREMLVAMTIVQGVGAVVALASVPAMVLLMAGIQVLMWLLFVGAQAAALQTPDRGARRAVVASLVFSFGALVVGTLVALYVAVLYGLFVACVLACIGYMYWIAYFNWLGIALRARELSARAARYTSAFVVGVVLLMGAAILLGNSTPAPARDRNQGDRAELPNAAANLPLNVVHLVLSVWLLIGYTKLTGAAESVIRERARAGTLPK